MTWWRSNPSRRLHAYPSRRLHAFGRVFRGLFALSSRRLHGLGRAFGRLPGIPSRRFLSRIAFGREELAVFALALALRLAWVGAIEWRGGALFGPDAPSYDALATNLLAGKGLQMQAWEGLFRDQHQTATVRAFRPPLLPIVLAGIYGVSGHHFLAARVVMALLSAATCVVVMRVARRLFGPPSGAGREEKSFGQDKRDSQCRGQKDSDSSYPVHPVNPVRTSSSTPVLAGVLMAVYPKLVYYGGEPVTETLCTLMLALAVWVLLTAFDEDYGRDGRNGREKDTESSHTDHPVDPVRASSSSPAECGLWRWPVGGALLALGALSRSSLLAFPAAAALWVVVARREKKRAVGEAALLLAGFALAMTPWWVRNARVFGHFVPATTEGGYTLWVTNNERATGGGHCFLPDPPGAFEGMSEYEIDRTFQRMGVEYIREHPGHFLRLAAGKFVRFWRLWPHADEPGVGLAAAIVAGLSFTPILLLALWGAVAARGRWRPLLLLYFLFLYYTLLHMVYMSITRYRVPIEPYLIVLAAAALADLRPRLSRRMDNGR